MTFNQIEKLNLVQGNTYMFEAEGKGTFAAEFRGICFSPHAEEEVLIVYVEEDILEFFDSEIKSVKEA